MKGLPIKTSFFFLCGAALTVGCQAEPTSPRPVDGESGSSVANAAAAYRVVNLGTLGGTTKEPVAINNAG
jgi:hypothetical protein